VIGLQPFQASLAVLTDLVSRKTAAVSVGFCEVGFAFDRIKDLRGQDHRVSAAASLGKPAAQYFLGVALFATSTVDVRSVEEVDAEL